VLRPDGQGAAFRFGENFSHGQSAIAEFDGEAILIIHF
jgi:hypothetical protein